MRAKITARLVDSLKTQGGVYEVNDTELPGFLLRVQPTGHKAYYLRYRRADGRQTRVKIGPSSVLTAPQARHSAQEYALAVAGGEDPQEAKRNARVETLRQFLEGPYSVRVAHLRTCHNILHVLKRDFAEFLDKPLSAVTAWNLEKWRKARLDKSMSAASINRPLAYLRTAMGHAVKLHLLHTNPCAGVRQLREDHSRVRFLTPKERAALMAALDKREQEARAARHRYNEWLTARGMATMPAISGFSDHLFPMVVLALNTGLRRGELFGLTWGDIDMARRVLTVRAATAKSGKARHVPLNNTAMAVLKKWGVKADKARLVFPGLGGKPLDNIQTAWEGLRDAAGLADLRFHDLRHDFASQLVMQGVPLNTVRDLLGHKDFTTTLRYAHLAPEATAAAVAVLDQVAADAEKQELEEAPAAG